jgi:hypothetical protein
MNRTTTILSSLLYMLMLIAFVVGIVWADVPVG